jgi:uncharacterized protein
MATQTHSLIFLALLLFMSGLLAGTLAGLLGVGGGIIMVPVLFYVFSAVPGLNSEVVMHMAVGTSLAAMIPTSLRSAYGHRARANVDMSVIRLWALPLICGAFFGLLIASHVKGPVLMGIFAFFALIVALQMGFGRDDWILSPKLPGRIPQSCMAFLIAGISVMMGIGGGTFGVPTLTLFGMPIHRAVGTAATLGVGIALVGGIGFIISGSAVPGRPPGSLGYASLIGMVALVPAAVIAAPWGVALSTRLNKLWLRRAFALFLALTGVRMGVKMLG